MKANIYRGQRVHVLADRCATCIFRAGNLMQLEPGRVKDMVDTCLAEQGVIPCHKTIYREGVDNAVCRGFYDAYRDDVQALQVAERMSVVVFDPVPSD